MAADATVPNNFVTGTPAVADDVDANFTAILTWLNTNAVHLDGSKAFTGAPSYAADPSTGNELARKSYVDAKADPRCGAWVARSSSDQTFAPGANAAFSFDTEVADSDGFWTSGSTVTIPTGKSGVYAITAALFNIGGLAPSNSFFGAYISMSGHANVSLGYTSNVSTEASGSAIVPLPAGSTVQVFVKNGSGSTSITAKCYLYVYRVSA